MNPLEIRYAVNRALADRDDIAGVEASSPAPGYPVELRVDTVDSSEPSGVRTFRVVFYDVDTPYRCDPPPHPMAR